MSRLSPRAQQLLGALQRTLFLLAEHDKVSPAEVNMIAGALISHLRSWRPMALIPRDTESMP